MSFNHIYYGRLPLPTCRLQPSQNGLIWTILHEGWSARELFLLLSKRCLELRNLKAIMKCG